VLTFLEQYADSVIRNRTIGGISATELFSRTTLFALPMVNPDGVALVTGQLEQSDTEYKTAQRIAAKYPQVSFPLGWKANIAGTDLNLNYPAGWEQARQNKFAQGFTSPAPRDFVGTAPLSAPESRAMYEFTRSNDFTRSRTL